MQKTRATKGKSKTLFTFGCMKSYTLNVVFLIVFIGVANCVFAQTMHRKVGMNVVAGPSFSLSRR